MKETRIFALDYGRGTMAAFFIDQNANDINPKPLINKDGEPSGFIKLKDGSYRLGRQLYTLAARDYKNVEKYHLNIKELPDGNDELQVEYASAWRKRIINDPKNKALFNDGCEEVWIIGCPTGWRNRKVIEDYRAIFLKAGFPDVIIVPESNAAMMYAEQTFNFMDRIDKSAGILCIDLGAYSSDSTFVTPGKVESYGGYVGASLIERMILAKNLSGEFCEESVNSDEMRNLVVAKAKSDVKFRTLLLLHAKNLKEVYYKGIVDGQEYADGLNCTESVDLRFSPDEKMNSCGRFFELVANDKMMHSIIEVESVRSVLGDEFDMLPDEVKSELGDKTWREALLSFVEKTLETCPRFAKAATGKGKDKARVILTGGASLMPFVLEVLMESMSGADIYTDRQPMSTIAMGLAYFGPDKLKARDFDNGFKRILECNSKGKKTSATDRIVNVIASRSHDILGLGSVYIKDENGGYSLQETRCDVGIVYNTALRMRDCIYFALDKWKRRELNSDEIASDACAMFEQWFDETMPELHKRGVEEAKAFVMGELNRIFNPLLHRHGMSGSLMKSDDLDLKYADEMLEWWRGRYEIFKRLLNDKGEMLSRLPNPDACVSLFGKSREDIYDSMRTEIEGIFDNWLNDLKCIFREDFDSPEVYGPFKRSCEKGIMQSLVRAKKTKLGELIVEESFDEET
jgi:hypothetical protein